MTLSPQETTIIEALRSKDWVCSTRFFIKDDRRRYVDLNNDGKNGEPVGYMFSRGWKIVGKPCDGRCGKKHKGRIFMRKAVKLGQGGTIPTPAPQITPQVNLEATQEAFWQSIPNHV